MNTNDGGSDVDSQGELKDFCIENDATLAQAQQIINKILERNLSTDGIMLEVALNEAINNGLRASGKVSLRIKRIGNRLIMRVRDYGSGFNTTALNARLRQLATDEDLNAEFDELQLAEGGRGMLMMKMACDRVVYNAKGNEVLLMKKL